MNDDEVLLALKEALSATAPELKTSIPVSMDRTLEELGIDSIVALEMAGRVETKFSIRLPDDDLAQVNYIRDFVRLVRQSLGEGSR